MQCHCLMVQWQCQGEERGTFRRNSRALRFLSYTEFGLIKLAPTLSTHVEQGMPPPPYPPLGCANLARVPTLAHVVSSYK